MKLKWLGHASALLEASGKVIYIDPYAGEYTKKADIIIVTHGHSDHLSPDKIRMIQRPDTVIISSKSCAENISGKVVPISVGDRKKIDGIELEAVHAYNISRFRSPGVPFHPKGLSIGVVLRSEGKTVFHASDTDFIPEMKTLPKLDIAMIPIGGTYTMDVPEAVQATLAMNPKLVLPMHRRESDVAELKRQVESRSTIKVIDLQENGEVEI